MNASPVKHLSSLPKAVQVPTYDRSTLTAGILHIGVGNFHRAHQAWYLHRLMQAGLAQDWALVGAGVRPGDAAMRERLLGQDCLSTLIMLDPEGTSAEVVGSMIDFVPVEANNRALVQRMAQPDIRIVSLTVTEGGYFIDPATQGFDAQHPDIQHDAAHPHTPRTAFGAMVEALRLRRQAGLGPFTGMSCDNIQGNGKILRQTVVSLARLSNPDLANWIDQNASFPNSMVDCIVPATGEAELARVRALGIDDAAPVTHERFRQWVIEDDFCQGRPEWEGVGATFTDAVHDFETMKIRILNGGHQVVSVVGELLSQQTIADCLAHPAISKLFKKVALDEIAPYVPAVPGKTPAEYVELIHDRFSNPLIRDTTRRVAFDGSSRHPGFILPSIRNGVAAGASVAGLALVEAAWATMCLGRREDGSEIEPNDPYWSELNTAAWAAKSDPLKWLEQRHIYGELAESEVFMAAFVAAYTRIQRDGVVSAIEQYCESA